MRKTQIAIHLAGAELVVVRIVKFGSDINVSRKKTSLKIIQEINKFAEQSVRIKITLGQGFRILLN